MKHFFLTALLVLNVSISYCQKALLPHSDIKWSVVADYTISKSGQYVSYRVSKYVRYSSSSKLETTLYVKSVDNKYKKEIAGGDDGKITGDSQFFIFKKGNNSIGVLSLGKDSISEINDVGPYDIVSCNSGDIIVYRQNTNLNNLVLVNLQSKKREFYSGIDDFFISQAGKIVVLKTKLLANHSDNYTILWINLEERKIDTVLKRCPNPTMFEFDKAGKQLTFLTHDSNKGEFSLRYYKVGLDSAIIKVEHGTPGIAENLTVSETAPVYFSNDGSKIFFSVKCLRTDSLKNETKQLPKIDIWSYKDHYLQSQQLKELNNDRSLSAVIAVNKNNAIQLATDNSQTTIDINMDNSGNFVLVRQRYNDDSEMYWNSMPSYYLVSTDDGSRKLLIKNRPIDFASLGFSLKGNYITWFDQISKSFFTYNIKTQRVVKFNANIKYSFFRLNTDAVPQPYGIAGWLDDDSRLLIYDQYDIWELDPNGTKSPKNITNSYGRRHSVTFRFLEANHHFGEISKLNLKRKLILTAFNNLNKDNGFYSIQPAVKNSLHMLTMGPFCYDESPSKAEDSNVYLIQKMSARQSPNLFLTSNFKDFLQITDNHPENNYNWISSELIKWKTFDGISAEGILYKPENFDPRKRYPVIFTYYEKQSDDLNKFLEGGPNDGDLDIPYFVSNGYLVCVPNIYFKIGKTGESAYNSVVSAAKYLSKKNYVSRSRMAIQGISMGGYETNFIITRTNLFAAAQECSGPSDFISGYDLIRPGSGNSCQYLFEYGGQNRLNANLWQNPKRFIENSPIFKADLIKTPLLMMHNINDESVPWEQGLEFFTALRRLKKKAWLLQYDNSGHGVYGEKDALDFEIRETQFFDYYLKSAPPPTWMTAGVPANLKGIDSGLEFDKSGLVP